MKLFIEYINDRYAEVFENAEVGAYHYIEWLENNGFSVLNRAYGFITYKFEGDACIIFDIHTAKEFRKTKKAWTLWNEMLGVIQQNPKCNVIIGFSEKLGTNHADGVGAMLAAGFVKAQETKEQDIYMRGTN